MKRFGSLVTGSYRSGGSQSNYHNACLEQSTPARSFLLDILSIYRTFLNQLMVVGRFPPYKQRLTN